MADERRTELILDAQVTESVKNFKEAVDAINKALEAHLRLASEINKIKSTKTGYSQAAKDLRQYGETADLAAKQSRELGQSVSIVSSSIQAQANVLKKSNDLYSQSVVAQSKLNRETVKTGAQVNATVVGLEKISKSVKKSTGQLFASAGGWAEATKQNVAFKESINATGTAVEIVSAQTGKMKEVINSISGVTTAQMKMNEEAKNTGTQVKGATEELAKVREAGKAVTGQMYETAGSFAEGGKQNKAFAQSAQDSANAIDKIAGKSKALSSASDGFQQLTTAQMKYNEQSKATGEQAKATVDNFNKTKEAGKAVTGQMYQTAGSFADTSKQTNTLKRNLDSVTKSATIFSKAGNAVLVSWQSVGRIVAGTLISRFTTDLIRGFEGFAATAKDFLIQVGEIRTISQRAQLTTDQWSDSLRKLSDQFGIAATDVAAAGYQALSDQMGEGAEATQFLNEALKLARITASNAGTSAAALAGVINAYSLDVTDASVVSGQLFKIIDIGRFTMDQIGESIGSVAVIAAQVGIEFEELGAALSTLSIQGLTAENSMTFMRNVILKLIRPTNAMKDFLDELGVSSGEAAIAAFGLGGFLQKLQEHVQSTNDPLNELGELFGRIRAIMGAAGLDFDKFARAEEEIKNSSIEAAEALKLVENAGRELQDELIQVKNVLTFDFGQETVKSLANINKNFIDLSNSVSKLLTVLKNLGIALISLAITRTVTAFYSLFTVVEITKHSATGATIVTYGYAKALATLRAATLSAATALGGLYTILGAGAVFLAIKAWRQYKREVEIIGKDVTKISAETSRALQQLAIETKEAIASEFKELDKVFNESFASVDRQIRKVLAGLKSEITGFLKNVETAEELLVLELETKIELGKVDEAFKQAEAIIKQWRANLAETIASPISDEEKLKAIKETQKKIKEVSAPFDDIPTNIEKVADKTKDAIKKLRAEMAQSKRGSGGIGDSSLERFIPGVTPRIISTDFGGAEDLLDELKRKANDASKSVDGAGRSIKSLGDELRDFGKDGQTNVAILKAVSESAKGIDLLKASEVQNEAESINRSIDSIIKKFGDLKADLERFQNAERDALGGTRDSAKTTEALLEGVIEKLKVFREQARKPQTLSGVRLYITERKNLSLATEEIDNFLKKIKAVGEAQSIGDGIKALEELNLTESLRQMGDLLRALQSAGVISKEEGKTIGDNISKAVIEATEEFERFKNATENVSQAQRVIGTLEESLAELLKIQQESAATDSVGSSIDIEKLRNAKAAINEFNAAYQFYLELRKQEAALGKDVERATPTIDLSPTRPLPTQTPIPDTKEAEEEIKNLQSSATSAVDAIAASLGRIAANLVGSGLSTVSANIEALALALTSKGDLPATLDSIAIAFGNIGTNIESFAASLISEGDLSIKVDSIAQALSNIGTALRFDGQLTTLSESIRVFLDNVVVLVQQTSGLSTQLLAAETANQNNLQQVAVQTTNVLRSQVGIMAQLVRQAQQLQAIAASTALPAVAGGLRFAAGGSTGAIGNDTKVGLFNEDEFVLNSKVSRQFLPLLAALNSGAKTPRNVSGGVITNVGDINVSVEGGGTPDITARRIGQALRRELHRGTLRLS